MLAPAKITYLGISARNPAPEAGFAVDMEKAAARCGLRLFRSGRGNLPVAGRLAGELALGLEDHIRHLLAVVALHSALLLQLGDLLGGVAVLLQVLGGVVADGLGEDDRRGGGGAPAPGPPSSNASAKRCPLHPSGALNHT